jgi:hypothetical protein
MAGKGSRSQPASELQNQLLSELRQWQPASTSQQDDITLIVVDVLLVEPAIHEKFTKRRSLPRCPYRNRCFILKASVNWDWLSLSGNFLTNWWAFVLA